MTDYRIVPAVATEAMVQNGMMTGRSWPTGWHSDVRGIYAAMLAASPAPPWTDIMAMATVAVDKTAAPHVLADADMRRTVICCTAEALRATFEAKP